MGFRSSWLFLPEGVKSSRLFTISLLLIWWDLFADPPRRFMMMLSDVCQRFAPAAASLIIVPLIVMDLLRLSNRFAGPARRLQSALRDLAEGKEVPPLMFRDNDFWQEMAAEFNHVNGRISQLVARQGSSQAVDASPETVTSEEPELAGRAE